MITLLSDHDIELYVRLLWGEFAPEEWREFGVSRMATFADVALHREATDRLVWQFCQRHTAVLLTGNRNMEDADSLEAVLRELNEPNSLPILTIAKPQRIVESIYREDCAYHIAGIVQDLEKYRGAARIFVP
jgi:hypothetical protein